MKHRAIIVFCLCFCIASLCAGFAQNQELKQRGFAGFTYRAITEKDAKDINLSDTTGIFVTNVFPNTPAQHAGLMTGDIIKKYDNHSISDSSQFLSVNRLYYANDKIKVSLLRAGKPLAVTLTLGEFPREKSSDTDIEYTSFYSGGISAGNARLRAVVTSPLHSKGKKLPALLMVSALGSPRLADTPSYNLSTELAHKIAKSGFRVLRFELRGYGDSEGEDYRISDFDAEINDNLAAFSYFAGRNDVDKNKVFVFGHSTGGIIAALTAEKTGAAGLIASCTVGRTFYERMGDTLRLQGELAGDTPAEIDNTIKNYFDLTTSIARGEPLEEIIKKNPAASKLVNKSGRIMDDRTPEYWKQQLNINLAEVYGKIKCPVLIIYGESDFLTQLACHKHIRDVLKSSGNKDVTLAVIPAMDHRYAYAKDCRESFENYKTSNFRENPEAVNEIIKWLGAK